MKIWTNSGWSRNQPVCRLHTLNYYYVETERLSLCDYEIMQLHEHLIRVAKKFFFGSCVTGNFDKKSSVMQTWGMYDSSDTRMV